MAGPLVSAATGQTKAGLPSDSLDPRSPAFHDDAVTFARRLIGGVFAVDGVGGTIIETEAYERTDPASHAFRGRTLRNAVMFGPVGHLYVYRSYGIHWCANIVCGTDGGSAVLLRAVLPETGIELMAERRGTGRLEFLCSGPGKLCQALRITGDLNGAAFGGRLFLTLPQAVVPAHATPRIGISKAVDQPWRFVAGEASPRRRRTRG